MTACLVCAARKEEIRELEQRLATLRGLVEECEAQTPADDETDYWTPAPMSQASAEFMSRHQPAPVVNTDLTDRVRTELLRNGKSHAAALLRDERSDLTTRQCIEFVKALAADEKAAAGSREGVAQ